MAHTRRDFLAATAGAASLAAAQAAPASTELNGFEIAKRHRIVRELPTPDFFEGMLLGNGDIGVCVTVRPDAIGLHIGKSDSWDIRVSEESVAHVLPFSELLDLWKRAGDEAKRQGKPDMIYLEHEIPFFREYTEKVAASYAKTWPRPWPCGIVWVHWDVPRFHVVRQTLDCSTGHFSLELEENGKPVTAACFREHRDWARSVCGAMLPRALNRSFIIRIWTRMRNCRSLELMRATLAAQLRIFRVPAVSGDRSHGRGFRILPHRARSGIRAARHCAGPVENRGTRRSSAHIANGREQVNHRTGRRTGRAYS